MSQKLITQLQLRDNFGDTVNLAGDDTIQTYRVTGAQIRTFLEPFYKQQVGFMKNVGLEIGTSAGALNIALKQANGTSDPVSGTINATEIAFRSPTITSPLEVIVPFESALSLTVPSGATLGYANGQNARVFIYAYFDGTNKGLAVCHQPLNEMLLHNLTILNTDSDDIIPYADANRTGAAIRLIGTVVIDSIAAAGVWTSPSRAGKSSFNDFFPAGFVMPFAGGSAPHGFLFCNGSAYSRTVYARLFESIGTRWGHGNGSTTFNVPDYRGRFLRGTDYGAARDPDRASRTAMNTGGATGDNLGSVQLDAMQQINGQYEEFMTTNSTGTGAMSSTTTVANSNWIGSSASFNRSRLIFNSANSPDARVSSETRGINASIDYYIKY
jgi:microcystin-dependent protein